MRRTSTALTLTALALGLTACSTGPAGRTAELVPVAAASSVGTPTGIAPAPAPGTVDRGPGPFDDRYEITGLALQGGAVTGALDITSDVSEIIVLEAHVAFYDATGALLGTAVQVHQPDHTTTSTAVPDETVALSVTAPPAYRSKVSAARLTVPVLVNE